MTHHLTSIKDQTMEIMASAYVSLPIKAPLSILSGMLAYMIGINNYASAVTIVTLICLDLITAIMSELKSGHSIESRKALKSATKLTVYMVFLSAMHLTEQLIPGTTFLNEIAASFLALTESISIMENIGNMGYEMPLKLLNRLKEIKESK